MTNDISPDDPPAYYPIHCLINHKTYEGLIYNSHAEGLQHYISQGFVIVPAWEYDKLMAYYPVLRQDYLAKLHALRLKRKQYAKDYRAAKMLGLTPGGKQSMQKRKPSR